ncbi:MAG: divalent-cation tolerance protein CutA [Nitrospiraceae bacterium]|nr:divalent-cation tolerance protein CutA [Nitrospiraceae bacterium]
MEHIAVFITAPDRETAADIARALVGEKLAGCVNIISSVRSIYSWQGNIEDETEALMVAKTKKSLFEKLNERVKELHPYQTPEIIALPVAAGSRQYLDWLNDVTG